MLVGDKIKASKKVVCLRPLRISWLVLAMTLFISQQEYAFGGSNMEISSSAFKDGEKIPIPYVMPGAGMKNTPSGNGYTSGTGSLTSPL